MKLTNPTIILGSMLACALAQTSNSTNATTKPIMYPLSTDDQFAFYFAEVLSNSNGGGASTGEVLRAASQIVPGDIDSFFTEFKFLADSIHTRALATNKTRSPASARSAFFRASTYYRGADFFLHGNTSDPRLHTIWAAALDSFAAAIELLPVPAEKITVPGPGFDIPVYFYPAHKPGCGQPAPTLLVGSGYDGPQESLYHMLGVHALERGWNFVTYEGPGQPTVRREQELGFRPDWWEVVTPVVDYLVNRTADVEADKIALAGISFGGSLAPRAASREHRLAAVLCIDGLESMQGAILEQLPETLVNIFTSGNATLFDQAIRFGYAQADTPTQFRWLIDQSLWAFNTTSPFDWLTRLGQFNVSKEILDGVTCPIFVGEGDHDTLALDQATKFWNMMDPDKGYYYQFKAEYGAGEHCQMGAEEQLAAVSLDWLAGVFEGTWSKGNGTVA